MLNEQKAMPNAKEFFWVEIMLNKHEIYIN